MFMEAITNCAEPFYCRKGHTVTASEWMESVLSVIGGNIILSTPGLSKVCLRCCQS